MHAKVLRVGFAILFSTASMPDGRVFSEDADYSLVAAAKINFPLANCLLFFPFAGFPLATFTTILPPAAVKALTS